MRKRKKIFDVLSIEIINLQFFASRMYLRDKTNSFKSKIINTSNVNFVVSKYFFAILVVVVILSIYIDIRLTNKSSRRYFIIRVLENQKFLIVMIDIVKILKLSMLLIYYRLYNNTNFFLCRIRAIIAIYENNSLLITRLIISNFYNITRND